MSIDATFRTACREIRFLKSHDKKEKTVSPSITRRQFERTNYYVNATMSISFDPNDTPSAVTLWSHPAFLHPCDAYASNGDTPLKSPANTGLGAGCPAKQSPKPKIARITKA